LSTTLATVDRIVVCPDGPLWQLPWDLLVRFALADEDGVPPVMEVVSAAALSEIRSSWGERSPDGNVVVVTRSTFGGQFRDLPGAIGEGRSVAAATAGRRCALLEGVDASRKRLLPLIEDADVLHFSTHAVADDETSTPWLVLSDGSGGNDLLSAAEIAELHLRASVVFLSACSSAIGRTSVGEGLTSIARAFLIAGAASVIAALWPIEDMAAAQFVGLYSTHLFRGNAPVDALAAAKTDARDAGMHPRWIHGFQVFGDGSKPSTLADIAGRLRTLTKD
jgi:CHAT domain-containing protein